MIYKTKITLTPQLTDVTSTLFVIRDTADSDSRLRNCVPKLIVVSYSNQTGSDQVINNCIGKVGKLGL